MQPGRHPRGLSNRYAAFLRGGTHRHSQLGFQLLELLIAVAIISVLAVIAIPGYSKYRDKVNNADAEADIQAISQAIEHYYIEANRYPDSLADVRMGGLLDPWGHSYQYLRINCAKLKGKGSLRKDKSLVPINTDFDLYSMGKDGSTIPPLTAKPSQDDIVRANNGKFIGLAADY